VANEARVFHEGERALQAREGRTEEAASLGRRMVRDYLTEEHRDFYEQLPFLVIGARDREGRPWATLLAGDAGVLEVPDTRRLRVRALPPVGDPLRGALSEGAEVGALGIEFHTRRRNRINGRVARESSGDLEISVKQAYGNCPQYIQERLYRVTKAADKPARSTSDIFTPALKRFVESADTFFIASGVTSRSDDRSGGMDASHRGGPPGFASVRGERELWFPDYAGNNLFNTLGNLQRDPRCGLLFVGFERGDTLQLTGRAVVDWEHPEIADIPGARRLVRFELDQALLLQDTLPLRFDRPAAEAALRLRVAHKVREAEDVMSLLLEHEDGGPLPSFLPGQYLTLELEVPGEPDPVVRTYSLSAAPDQKCYRITVKRETLGVGSRFLHDQIQVGQVLGARPPRGDFALDTSGDRPVVLLSAGVGVTPMVSMLGALLKRDERRMVWFVHGARSGREHALRDNVRCAAAGSEHVIVHVAYSRPEPGDVQGRDYDSEGRVDGTLLDALLSDLEADFYLCGPPPFMGSLLDALAERRVPDERIHTETFGPSSG
jgi:ferredoxin-NADP reductase/predicted pyridoxine 5'-phosphate oxidase superfamily flavin-nucleotide-binding protein